MSAMPKKTDQQFTSQISDATLYGPIDPKNPDSWPEQLRECRWSWLKEHAYQKRRKMAEQKGEPIPPRFDPSSGTDFRGKPIPKLEPAVISKAIEQQAETTSPKMTVVVFSKHADDEYVGQVLGNEFPYDVPEKQCTDENYISEREIEELDLSGQKLPSTYPTSAFGQHAMAVRAIASHLQVAESMIGSILVVIVAALAQAFVGVSAYAGARGIPVSIFLMLIAESGERKSSTIEALLRLVLAILRKATDQRRQLILGDPTVDGTIIGLIRRCPAQLLLAPEGATLLGSHAMISNSLPRFAGTLTSVYSGEPISRVRAKEYEYAEDRRLSAMIAVQEVIATGFLSNDLVMQQGLANRFIYDKPASKMGRCTLSRTDLQQNEDYQSLAGHLSRLAAHPWTIDDDTGGVCTRTICLSDDAFELWEVFYNHIESQLGKGGQLVNHAGYASRFSEQVLRFASNLAVLDDPEVTAISGEVTERAMELAEYYLPTTLHLFSAAPANADEQHANTLLDWMRNKARELGLPAVPARMIYKDGPRCARPAKRAGELLSLLIARVDVDIYRGIVRYGNNLRTEDNYAV